jgi:DNA-binding NarL/FixJ family response regulator
LEKLPAIQVVAEAKDGREAISLVEKHHPDVVLMDIAMPGLNGLETTARIKSAFPNVQVIMLSMYSSEDYVHKSIAAGAAGYLVKSGAAAELENAIKIVVQGGEYFSSLVSQHLVKNRAGHATGTRAILDRLTPRQREILQLIAERHHTKDIAQILNISVKTVETHRAQLMHRLGIYDVPGLVRFAIRAGLASLEE